MKICTTLIQFFELLHEIIKQTNKQQQLKQQQEPGVI